MAAGLVLKIEYREGCLSAQVNSQNLFRAGAQPYVCRVLPWSDITCACESFQAVGGFCKHLRAALLKVSCICALRKTVAFVML
jgi:uncharacterized Zn finger protein